VVRRVLREEIREKARLRLGYAPRYWSLADVQESVAWPLERGRMERKETG